MFQFRRFPSHTYELGMRCKGLTPCGFLHSDICGSFRACRSPQLFAAYRVLLRLLMPRHPSCALISLTYLFRIMVSSLGHIFRCFPTEEFLRNCIYPFNLSLNLDIYFCFKIVSSLLFRYSIFKEPFSSIRPLKSFWWCCHFFPFWWAEEDSNLRPLGYQPSALTSWAISP